MEKQTTVVSRTKDFSRADYSIERATELLDQVARQLQSSKWFKDGWLTSVHCFPPPPSEPESVTLHVYKKHWYNDDHRGIHFETNLGPEQFATGQVPVMLHILHTPTVPGTKIKRIKITQPFVDEIFDTVSEWDGYAFRVGKYGTQPFSCKLAFTLDDVVDKLASEIGRMCETLGPTLDRVVLEQVGGATKKGSNDRRDRSGFESHEE
ncbi:MAG: hypothetical protein IPL73_10270 [Candidatus Obscuribacter sp.]|nr:hypothetical protein [Candidatus Obscuribacter sp.]